MEKHTVNLLIRKTDEPAVLVKLRIYLPIMAAAGMLLFVISFLASVIYVGQNSRQFNALNTQIDNAEKRISGSKNAEGIYTLSYFRISTLGELKKGSKNYAKLLSDVLKMQSAGVSVSQITVDGKNSVAATVTASSAATLDNFASVLFKADADKKYSDIKTSGIVRDKTGGYLLTILMKPDNSLLQ